MAPGYHISLMSTCNNEHTYLSVLNQSFLYLVKLKKGLIDCH